MEFIFKLENLINNLLIKLGELIIRYTQRCTPSVLIKIFKKLTYWSCYVVKNFKALPKILKELLFKWIKEMRATIAVIDFRAKLSESYQIALNQYKAKSTKGISAVKTIFLAPFLLIGQWLQGLNTTQSVLLLGFSAASILAGIAIISSGQRLAGTYATDLYQRSPASIEEELKYDRPQYYKQQIRHLEVNNVRLPVYFAVINELRTVDIDFNATISNRQGRKFLEKHEFQLRDHLILHMELLLAKFPLEEEGKEMLRQKIWEEINSFLKQNNIEGYVEDLKVTYILAN